MTGRNAMIHRTTIQRDSNAQADDAKDDWGNPLEASFEATTDIGTVPCRYWYDVSASHFDSEKRIFVEQHFVMFPFGTDVTRDDRCLNITDRRGNVLVEGPLRIDELGTHELDHMIAKLVRAS